MTPHEFMVTNLVSFYRSTASQCRDMAMNRLSKFEPLNGLDEQAKAAAELATALQKNPPTRKTMLVLFPKFLDGSLTAADIPQPDDEPIEGAEVPA